MHVQLLLLIFALPKQISAVDLVWNSLHTDTESKQAVEANGRSVFVHSFISRIAPQTYHCKPSDSVSATIPQLSDSGDLIASGGLNRRFGWGQGPAAKWGGVRD
jgi:hypothetical protein